MIFVVRGRENWPATLDLATDASIEIVEESAIGGYNRAIDVADIDGDGYDDIATGHWLADGSGGRTYAGQGVVYFGSSETTRVYSFGEDDWESLE